ncbi:Hypothetical_protein [Hexamita inflata]|uniref:Hypothetical_protein n=1 Tax=Hexamita inflata TaxID=28002 RepID=A0AA86UY90_9EUKA|nr:Hypothetical protein HINF_LOCUS60419 [Hexamita inflata]
MPIMNKFLLKIELNFQKRIQYILELYRLIEQMIYISTTRSTKSEILKRKQNLLIGKLDMNKFAPLADLGEDNDKSEKEPIEKFLFQQNKWNNSHKVTATHSQMGENRRRKSNHQKSNTLTRQINRQNKFASLNSEYSSSNSGNFSHYQEQPHRKEYNVPRTDHRKPDKVDYSAISEASEALQSLVQSCSSSMKKSFKQNNQSFRSQKQTEHNKKNKQNNQSNTEQNKPKGSKQNQSKKNQIKELVKSFNKILNGNQKPKGNSFTGQNVFQVIFLSPCFFLVSLNLRITAAAVSNQLYNSLYNLAIFSLRDQIFLSLPFALGITLVWVGQSGFFFVDVSSSILLSFSAVCVDFFLVFVLWAFSKFFSVYLDFAGTSLIGDCVATFIIPFS